MRSLVMGLALILAAMVAGGAQAGRLAAPGPNPDWTDNQKFEWYLGYMSKAATTCGNFSASNELNEIASLSPYGRIGLQGTSADRFTGPACGGILKRINELLQKKETYIRYLSESYDCSAGAGPGCIVEGSDRATANHTCGTNVDEALAGLKVDNAEIKSVEIDSRTQGIGSVSDPHHTARIRLQSCRGSLYLELGAQCNLRKSYTRGDCEVAGVSAY